MWMKIRHGFVSNSSTTSFCIFGAKIRPPYDEEREEAEDDYDAHEEFYEKCYEQGLDCHSTPWDNGCFVGEEWSTIKDDETGAQFKERVAKKLHELFGVDLSICATYAEAWRDG